MIYSSCSRGVDLLDQMISCYNVDIKSRKWYLKVVILWLQIILHNSYNCYSNSTPKSITFLKYHQSIIKSLISGIKEGKKIQSTPAKPILQKKKVIPGIKDCQGGYEGGKKKCQICLSMGISKISSYICKTHKISVCVLYCYDYHRKNIELIFFNLLK